MIYVEFVFTILHKNISRLSNYLPLMLQTNKYCVWINKWKMKPNTLLITNITFQDSELKIFTRYRHCGWAKKVYVKNRFNRFLSILGIHWMKKIYFYSSADFRFLKENVFVCINYKEGDSNG